MRILGLDLSLTAAGVCHINAPEGCTVPTIVREESTVLKVGALRGVERLDELWRQIWYYASPAGPRGTHDFQSVDLVAIEGYAFSRGTAGIALGELGGVVRLGLHRQHIPYVELGPGVWRKAVLGKGNLAKDQVRVEAWKRYGVEFDDLNTLEAWGVAMGAWLQQTGQVKPAIKRARKSAA